jgi:hypothetical protein
MRDEAQLEQMRSTLALDGYQLNVTETGAGFDVRIIAGPESCADCLVPKPIMISMLQPVLGVDAEAIRLSYPTDGDPTGGDPTDGDKAP